VLNNRPHISFLQFRSFIQRIRPSPWPSVTFCNRIDLYGKLSQRAYFQAGEPPLVGCPRLIIIHCYPHKPGHTPRRGDRGRNREQAALSLSISRLLHVHEQTRGYANLQRSSGVLFRSRAKCAKEKGVTRRGWSGPCFIAAARTNLTETHEHCIMSAPFRHIWGGHLHVLNTVILHTRQCRDGDNSNLAFCRMHTLTAFISLR
jgi:hypothetical protein